MKRLGLTLLIAIPLLFIAVQFGLQLIPLERVRPMLEEELAEILDLEVRIQGRIQASLVPWLRLRVEDVVFASPPDRPSPALLEIGGLELELRLLPLLTRSVVVEMLAFDDVVLRLDVDPNGGLGLRVELDELDERPGADDGDAVRLSLRRLEVRNLEIFVDPYDRGPVRSLRIDRARVETDGRDDPIRAEASGDFEGTHFDLSAVLGSLSELAAPSRPFPVQLSASVAEGRMEVEGTLEDPLAFRGLDLGVEAVVMNPAARLHELGFAMPPLGSFDLAGRIHDREGKIGIDAFRAMSREEGPIELAIDGAIEDLVQAEGVKLAITLAAVDVDVLEALTTLSLPKVPLRVRLGLDDLDGSLGIEGDAEVAKPGVFELSASGVFDDLRQAEELDLRVQLASLDLSTLGQALARHHSFALPAMGPLASSARLRIEQGRLALDEIEIRIGDRSGPWVELDGTIHDLLSTKGVDLEVRFGARSARRVARLFDREVPELGPVSGALSIHDEDGTLGVEWAEVEVGHPGAFFVRVKGAFDDLRDLNEIGLEAKLEAPDLSVIAQLTDSELPAIGPILFEGDVQGSDEELRAKGRLTVGSTLFVGQFDGAAPPGERPSFDVRVHATRLDLKDLFKPSGPRPRLDLARRSAGLDFAAWWRGEVELPLERLRELDGRIRLTADRVVGYDLLDLEGLSMAASLKDGVLVLEDSFAEYESGKVTGRAKLDTRSRRPDLAVELEAFNVDLTRLMSQFIADTDVAGTLDISLDLETAGATAHELRSNLDGVVGAMLRQGALVGEYSQAFAINAIRVSMPSFAFREQDEAPVQCLLVLLPIKGGVATTEALYLEGRNVTISGRGQVDFVRNAYDLILTPRLHEPGLVSVAATVEVTGALGSPEFTPLRRSMVKSALSALWHNAIRPARAIDQLIRRSASDEEDSSVCGQILVQRLDQMQTDRVEPIDLEKILSPAAAPADGGGEVLAPPVVDATLPVVP